MKKTILIVSDDLERLNELRLAALELMREYFRKDYVVIALPATERTAVSCQDLNKNLFLVCVEDTVNEKIADQIKAACNKTRIDYFVDKEELLQTIKNKPNRRIINGKNHHGFLSNNSIYRCYHPRDRLLR